MCFCLQLSLLVAAKASNDQEQELSDLAYELLLKLGVDSGFGLCPAADLHGDGRISNREIICTVCQIQFKSIHSLQSQTALDLITVISVK